MTEEEINIFKERTLNKKIRFTQMRPGDFFIPTKFLCYDGGLSMTGFHYNGDKQIIGEVLFKALNGFESYEGYRWELLEKEEIECECGAHMTRNPNLHSYWCPAFKKYK